MHNAGSLAFYETVQQTGAIDAIVAATTCIVTQGFRQPPLHHDNVGH